jgi:hypothetical protein
VRRTIAVVDDESEGPDLPEPEAVAYDVAAPVPAPEERSPRQVRARRRRRRRLLGTLLFVIVAVGVVAAAYFVFAGGGDNSASSNATSASTTTPATTVAAFFSGSYKTTAGVNVRQSPATTAPTVATVEQGHAVTVVCVANGETVNAPSGPNPQWLKVAGSWPVGYISAAYVDTGQDLTTKKIPACTS